MANYYKIWVDEAYTSWFYASTDFANAQIDLNSAWAFWNAPNDHAAIQRSLMCLQHILDGVWSIISTSDTPFYYPSLLKAMQQAWEYETEEMPETTWKSIVEAWFKDDFEGRAVTIACIDRMRQLVWDEPFSVIWAAKPEEQELPE